MVVNFTWFLATVLLPVLLCTPVSARSPNFYKGIKGNETFICNARGRFAHPTDCVSFFECLRNILHGGLHAVRHRCPPTEGFHHKLKKCVSLKKLKGCNPRQGRTDTLTPELNPRCVADAASFFCADCQTLVHCIDGKAWTEHCSASYFCAEGKADFEDAVCYPSEEVQNCTCAGKKSYAPDPYDRTKFFSCDSEESDPAFYQCSVNSEFDPEKKTCADVEGLPACTKQGDFANPDDCSKYYSCLSSKDGWLRKSHECGPQEMFSEVNSTCENPCSWASSGDFACTREGRFKDVTDCRRFYVCINSADGFITKKRSCPDKHHWQSNEEGSSGKCISDNEADCTVVTPSKCVVPAEWCPGSEGGSTDTAAAAEGSADNSAAAGGPADNTTDAGLPADNTEAAGGSVDNAAASAVGGPADTAAAPDSAGGPVDTALAAAAPDSAGGPVNTALAAAAPDSAGGPVDTALAAVESTDNPAPGVSTDILTDAGGSVETSTVAEGGSVETTTLSAVVSSDIKPEETDVTNSPAVAAVDEPENSGGTDESVTTSKAPGVVESPIQPENEEDSFTTVENLENTEIVSATDETTQVPENFIVRSGVEPSKQDDPIAFIRNILLNKNY